MPTFYEGEAFLTLENSVSEEDYVHAWRLYQDRFGALRHREFWVMGAGVLLAVYALCYLYPAWPVLWTDFLPVVLLLALIAVFLFVQPYAAQREGQARYRQNQLLQLPMELQLYRDSYIEQNEYERLQGHWTDMNGCVETAALFVAMGGWDRRLLVIPKRSLTEAQVETLRAHFQDAFARKFYRIQK